MFPGGEKYSAVYTYAGQYEDELSFEAGDVIMVLAKDEADWWKGECNGKTGVFPSNYVEPLKCKSGQFPFLLSTNYLSELTKHCPMSFSSASSRIVQSSLMVFYVF